MAKMQKVTPALCKKCVYSSKEKTDEPICNYILDTGKRRGCKLGECDKFVEGKRKTEKRQIALI